MSAPLAPSTSRASGSAGAASARPQMQSRRVSLKLGPFGITYSTDQVLWTGEAAQAAAQATQSAGTLAEPASQSANPSASQFANEPLADSTGQATGQAPGLATETPGTETSSQAQQAQTQGEAPQTGRTFSREMLDAWRRQVEARAQATQTYGPGAAKGGEAAGGLASSAATAGAATAGAATSSASAPDASAAAMSAAAATSGAVSGVGAEVAKGAVSGAEGVGTQASAQAPVSRVRRAIAAYLACAQGFNATGPMLTAVA